MLAHASPTFASGSGIYVKSAARRATAFLESGAKKIGLDMANAPLLALYGE